MPAAIVALAATVLWTSPCRAQQNDAGGRERFEVGLWVDHQDYATPSGGAPWDTVSPVGLERIISYCRSAGATAIYFRGFGGGLTVHNSAVEEGLYPQLYDKRRTSDPLFYNGGVRYGNCDPDIVGTVVDICHRRGLRCLLYWPWEDTHNLMAFISRFSLENPGLWDERHDGYASPARLSPAFDQVRGYKLQLARELLSLGVDGFFIDYRRQSNWSPEFGYVAPAAAAHQRQYGRGPDAASEQWLRLRAAYQTRFLEDLRALCDEAGRPVQIIAAPSTVGADPMKQLKDSFVDWPTWVAMGLIDGLAPDGLPFDPARPRKDGTGRRGTGLRRRHTNHRPRELPHAISCRSGCDPYGLRRIGRRRARACHHRRADRTGARGRSALGQRGPICQRLPVRGRDPLAPGEGRRLGPPLRPV